VRELGALHEWIFGMHVSDDFMIAPESIRNRM
jgi:hypothetical protein